MTRKLHIPSSGTAAPDTAAPPGGPASREHLWTLWHGLLAFCLRYMSTTPPEKQRASMLAIIRAFLLDNGIQVNGRTIPELQNDAETLHAMSLPFKEKH